MRATLAACLVVALLAAGAAPAAAQLPPTIQALLERKELRPFINEVRWKRCAGPWCTHAAPARLRRWAPPPLETGSVAPHGSLAGPHLPSPAGRLPAPAPQVLGIRACLSDPNLSQFNIDQCPSLLRLLDALNLGNTNPAVSCEDSCVQQFAKVGTRACACVCGWGWPTAELARASWHAACSRAAMHHAGSALRSLSPPPRGAASQPLALARPVCRPCSCLTRAPRTFGTNSRATPPPLAAWPPSSLWPATRWAAKAVERDASVGGEGGCSSELSCEQVGRGLPCCAVACEGLPPQQPRMPLLTGLRGSAQPTAPAAAPPPSWLQLVADKLAAAAPSPAPAEPLPLVTPSVEAEVVESPPGELQQCGAQRAAMRRRLSAGKAVFARQFAAGMLSPHALLPAAAPVPEPVPVAPTTSGASALPKAALSALALVAAAAFTLA